jgi:hypothetical protein
VQEVALGVHRGGDEGTVACALVGAPVKPPLGPASVQPARPAPQAPALERERGRPVIVLVRQPAA